MATSFFHFLFTKLRLSNPWNYKVALLIAFPYFICLYGNLTGNIFFYSILASFICVFGFLGLAYVLNDLNDQRKDFLAGKNNAISGLKNSQIIGLLLLFSLLAFLPWLYLPFSLISGLLVFAEVMLLMLYSIPPFRLKEKGIWGLICDSLYAHAIPALLASWTFILLIGFENFPIFRKYIIALGIWQFISGLRNILSHQIKDAENDVLSDTRTLVVKWGVNKSKRLLNKILIPSELVSLLFFVFVIQEKVSILIPSLVLVWIYGIFLWKTRILDKTETKSKQFTNVFLDNFYINWLPLTCLFSSVLKQTDFFHILITHLLVFGLIPKINSHINSYTLGRVFIHRMFEFNSLFKGILLHLFVLITYSSLFLALYFFIEDSIPDPQLFFIYQKTISRFYLFCIITHAYSFFINRKQQTISAFKTFFLEKGTALNLSVFRIIFFSYILFDYSSTVFGSFSTWSFLPEYTRVPLPFISWFIEIIPINPTLYSQIAETGFVLAILSLLGIGTKWSIKLYAIVALYLWGVPCFFGKLNHHHIMVWIPIILAFSPSGDQLSIDYFIKKWRRKKMDLTPSLSYALPLKAIWISLAIIYFFSGFYKLLNLGFYWALSDNLLNQIQLEWVENYDTLASFRIDHFPNLLHVLGFGVILFELTYPIWLINASTRFINFIGSWSFHLSAGHFLNIDFANLRRAHFSLINWRKVQLFFTPHKNYKKDEIELASFHEFKKLGFVYVAGILIGFNLLFSMFNISSWPFSAYPSYTYLVEKTVKLVEMKALDSQNREVNVKELGKQQNFRWENIRPFEMRIAETFEKGDSVNLKIQLKNYWNLWATKVKGLENVVEVKMTLVTSPIQPEDRDLIIDSKYLGKVDLN